MTTASVRQTDDRGEYRIFGLKPGEYYLKATETGGGPVLGGMYNGMGGERSLVQALASQFAPMYFPGVLQLDQAQAVVLQAGEEMRADLAMRRIKLVEVTLRVMGADGGPETEAYVHLLPAGVRDWFSELSAPTDSKGQFSIKGVPPVSTTSVPAHMNEGKHAVVLEPIAEEAESKPGNTEVEKNGSFELKGVLDRLCAGGVFTGAGLVREIGTSGQ
jgi:hypothetical protein